jgi:FtsH-binding integral membrane protein
MASMRQSTVEERAYNMNFLKMVYTLFALQLLVAFGLSAFAAAYDDSFAWIRSLWPLGLVCLVGCLLLVAATMLNPATRQSPLNVAVYLGFLALFAFGMACFSSLDRSGLVFFVLCSLTLISLGFMLYAT